MFQSQPPSIPSSSWEEANFCPEHKDIDCSLELALPSNNFVPAVENYNFGGDYYVDHDEGEAKVNMISVAWDSVHGSCSSSLAQGFMDNDISMANQEDLCLNSGIHDQTEYNVVAADAVAQNDHYSEEENPRWSPKDHNVLNKIPTHRAHYNNIGGLQADEGSVGLVQNMSRDYPVEGAAVRESSAGWVRSFSKRDRSPEDPEWLPKVATINSKAKDSSTHGDDQALNYGVAAGSRNAPRVCVDCKTTKTPLWRSGPHGPKSLCNACGIRYRKARRALSAMGSADHIAAYNSKLHKRKKQVEDREAGRLHKFVHYKKRSRLSITSCKKNINVKFTANPSQDSFQRVFAEDEKEAAVLLMALSCGLVHV